MKQHLGDGVYVEIDRGMIKLTTDDGTGPTNTIYLELEVYHALVMWTRSHLVTKPHDDGARFVIELKEQC